MDHAKLNHDRVIKPAVYDAGDLVLLTNPIVKEGQTSKLAHKWTGPYKVVQKVNEEGYIIRTVDSLFEYLPRSKNQRVHHNRLKRYFGGPIPLNETIANTSCLPSASQPAQPTTTLVRVGRRTKAVERSQPVSSLNDDTFASTTRLLYRYPLLLLNNKRIHRCRLLLHHHLLSRRNKGIIWCAKSVPPTTQTKTQIHQTNTSITQILPAKFLIHGFIFSQLWPPFEIKPILFFLANVVKFILLDVSVL